MYVIMVMAVCYFKHKVIWFRKPHKKLNQNLLDIDLN